SFVCEPAYDFESAMAKITVYDYACVILDINLPGGSGLRLLRELKDNHKEDGVLIISARDALDDRVKGLQLGADDYLTKPFHLPELAARVAAIIRRKHFNGSNTVRFDELLLDLNSKTASAGKKTIELTKKEYELLLYFISNKNRVVSKEAIAQHLWGDDMEDAGNFDFLYTHIKNLRRKLLQGGCPDYIHAIYGMGYKFSL
ncbi:MAG: response regulator transcription factor, partial [Bacteroidetes bacterium]|nr:response regulator transcription factor [Bacteroidota bacterium]